MGGGRRAGGGPHSPLDTARRRGAARAAPRSRGAAPLPPSLHARSVHPAVKLQKIPTLFRWAANGKRPANALVEGQCKVAGDVLELVNASE